MDRVEEVYTAAELSEDRLAGLLTRLPELAVAVFGDFFLDRYLVIDRSLSETSLETGLEAYQVVSKRRGPGAAGTVTSNLRALGVATVYALGLIGDDGEGYELRQGLARTGVSAEYLVVQSDRDTPTYTKPMLRERDGTEREIQRLDVKSRRALSRDAENELIDRLEACVARADAVMVSDQVQQRNHGVVTDRLRARLAELAGEYPDKVFSADSRARIGEFRGLILKPNRSEAGAAIDSGWVAGSRPPARPLVAGWGLELARRCGRPAYVTLGEDGILLCLVDPALARGRTVHVPGMPVAGPIDVVGAGDSTAAGIVSALCAGASLEEAALVGNLAASITIQQLGTTGTASPDQVVARLRELRRA